MQEDEIPVYMTQKGQRRMICTVDGKFRRYLTFKSAGKTITVNAYSFLTEIMSVMGFKL